MVVNACKTAIDALGYGKLREDVRHLAEQASPAQSALGRHAQKNAVEAADMAVVEDLQIQPLELTQSLSVGRRRKDP